MRPTYIRSLPPPPPYPQVESLVDQLAASKREAALGGDGGGGDGLELAVFRSRTALSRQSFRGKTQFAQVSASPSGAAHGGGGAAASGQTRPSSGSFTRQASGSITRQPSGSGSSSIGLARPRGDGSGASAQGGPQGRLNRSGSVRDRGPSVSAGASPGTTGTQPADPEPAADSAVHFASVNPMAKSP